MFVPGRNDGVFKNWMYKGAKQVKDLYKDAIMMSFQQLMREYDIPQKYFFKYLQIRSFIHSEMKTYLEHSLSTIEEHTLKHLRDKGNLSLYISKDEWMKSCLFAQTYSVNTRCRLLQYKWHMRTYITPVKLHKCNPNIPDSCLKCKQEIGTLYHWMWECVEIKKFWKNILVMIGKLTEENIPCDPKFC